MAFYIFSTLFTIIFSAVALPVAMVVRGSAARSIAVVGMRGLLWFCKVCDGITYEVVGRENLPCGPFIVGSEHQSTLDPMILYVELGGPAFVLKKEFKTFPIIGFWGILLGMIYIDRSQKVAALKKMIRECRKRSESGRVLVVFPEGTRSTGHPSTKQYQEGIAAIYQSLHIPVVPVMLDTGKFWPGKIITLGKKPGKVTLRIMPPIQPGLERKTFMEEFKNGMIAGGGDLFESLP